MSPKTATISLALLVISLTLTLSSASNKCPDFQSVVDVLKHYELPQIFPDDFVDDFSCEYIGSGKESLKLSIELRGHCSVTKELIGVKNVLNYDKQISATLSKRKLANVKGVTVEISGNIPPPFLPGLMKITSVQGFNSEVLGTFVQFYFNENCIMSQTEGCECTREFPASPSFHILFFQNPPQCAQKPEDVCTDKCKLPFSPLLVA